eukprot:162291-Chlamydomonas_euryale.AAC.1
MTFNRAPQCCTCPALPTPGPSTPPHSLPLLTAVHCHGSVVSMTYNGAPQYYTWSSVFSTQGRYNLKILGLRLTPATANGNVVCLSLGYTCPDLTSFCYPQTGDCQVALFDHAPFPCCPISHIGGPLPPG